MLVATSLQERLAIDVDVTIYIATAIVLFLVVETNLGKLKKFVAREWSPPDIKYLLGTRERISRNR